VRNQKESKIGKIMVIRRLNRIKMSQLTRIVSLTPERWKKIESPGGEESVETVNPGSDIEIIELESDEAEEEIGTKDQVGVQNGFGMGIDEEDLQNL